MNDTERAMSHARRSWLTDYHADGDELSVEIARRRQQLDTSATHSRSVTSLRGDVGHASLEYKVAYVAALEDLRIEAKRAERQAKRAGVQAR